MRRRPKIRVIIFICSFFSLFPSCLGCQADIQRLQRELGRNSDIWPASASFMAVQAKWSSCSDFRDFAKFSFCGTMVNF